MANPPICGWFNSQDATVVEASTWDINITSYPGPVVGETRVGCKSKQDYRNRHYFFAEDTRTHQLYLARYTYDPSTGLVTYLARTIPNFDQAEGAPTPNQLTVDKDGNIFFPFGAQTQADSIIIAKVTEAQFEAGSLSPTAIYYQIPIDDATECVGSYGISLAKSHTVGVVYCRTTMGTETGDQMVFFETGSMAYLDQTNAWTGQSMAGATIQNIETDVSGGYNDNRATCFQNDSGEAILMITCLMAFPYTTTYKVVETEADLSCAIDNFGAVFGVEINKYCPGSPNLLYGWQSAGAGTFGLMFTFSIVCDQTITKVPPGGTTTTMRSPMHIDVIRSSSYERLAISSSGTGNGDVRDKIIGGTEVCREINGGFDFPSVAAYREAHT